MAHQHIIGAELTIRTFSYCSDIFHNRAVQFNHKQMKILISLDGVRMNM